MLKKVINISKIYTWETTKNSLQVIKNHEILIKDDKIIKISKKIDDFTNITIDAKQCIVTPGFIDSHTHPIFLGNRSDEFHKRLNGHTYEEIKKTGGGILSSIKKLRKASFEELYLNSLKNIKPFIKYGTTTLEAKSGYGLTLEDEIKSLEVIKKINNNLELDILPTFLGAHAVPPELKTSEYVEKICKDMIPEIAEKKLAIFCDVFCEDGYFNIDESRKILNTAKSFGMTPRLHADEFKYFGASELAAEVSAISADHLMVINERGIKALSNSNTIATLLPGTTFFLNKDKYADGRKLIDGGCSVALATDFNPGTCTIRSMPNIIFLAMQNCGMSLSESFLAVTYNAAKSLNISHMSGLIQEGYNADILMWDLDDLKEIPYWHDSANTKIFKVIKNGKEVN